MVKAKSISISYFKRIETNIITWRGNKKLTMQHYLLKTLRPQNILSRFQVDLWKFCLWVFQLLCNSLFRYYNLVFCWSLIFIITTADLTAYPVFLYKYVLTENVSIYHKEKHWHRKYNLMKFLNLARRPTLDIHHGCEIYQMIYWQGICNDMQQNTENFTGTGMTSGRTFSWKLMFHLLFF
jgi:hypothetical protein